MFLSPVCGFVWLYSSYPTNNAIHRNYVLASCVLTKQVKELCFAKSSPFAIKTKRIMQQHHTLIKKISNYELLAFYCPGEYTHWCWKFKRLVALLAILHSVWEINTHYNIPFPPKMIRQDVQRFLCVHPSKVLHNLVNAIFYIFSLLSLSKNFIFSIHCHKLLEHNRM
jgi:hypothetical protein